MAPFQRFRHSRGFGVHSPFAFRFINEVLCEQLHYYDYDRLPTAEMRLAYRLAAFLQPTELRAEAAVSHLEKAAMMATQGQPGRPPLWALMDAAPLAIASPAADPEALAAAVAGGCNALIKYADPAALQAVMDAMDGGMVFDNEKGLAVIIASPRLPKQYFNLSIP